MNNENFQKMSRTDIGLCKKGVASIAGISRKLGVRNVQSARFMRDSVVGHLLSPDVKMNTNIRGWDGILPDGTKFECKNITSSAKTQTSYALTLQDISHEKLMEFAQGAICVLSFWGDAAEPDFCLVGNSKMVADELIRSYNPNGYRSRASVGFQKCLEKGFKLVAVNFDREQTMDSVSIIFPKIALMPLESIMTKEQLPEIARQMSK